MSKPSPDPFEPSELPAMARKVIEEAKFPMLASMDDDQPRLRPVSPVRVDGYTVYVANIRSYHKTGEIAANPKVELCYLAPNHDQLRITGVASELGKDDQALIDEIWEENPLLRQYLGMSDNPELIIYRIVPHRVRFMREWALNYHDVPVPIGE
jgi:general stress protein 26